MSLATLMCVVPCTLLVIFSYLLAQMKVALIISVMR